MIPIDNMPDTSQTGRVQIQFNDQKDKEVHDYDTAMMMRHSKPLAEKITVTDSAQRVNGLHGASNG